MNEPVFTIRTIKIDRSMIGTGTGDWRVVVSLGSYDAEDLDVMVDKLMTWPEAHKYLVERFESWTRDACPHCAGHAAEQLPALRELQPDQEWRGEVEGDDYLLMRADNG